MRCTCCKGCEKRQVGCHVTCEDYIEFTKKNEEEKKKIEIEKVAYIIKHKVGSPGICFGVPTKRRTRYNAYK